MTAPTNDLLDEMMRDDGPCTCVKCGTDSGTFYRFDEGNQCDGCIVRELIQARRTLAKVRAEVEPVATLAEKATPGEWRALLKSHGLTGVHADMPGGSSVKLYHATLADEAHPDTHRRQKDDASFIAAARNLIPRLARVLDGEE